MANSGIFSLKLFATKFQTKTMELTAEFASFPALPLHPSFVHVFKADIVVRKLLTVVILVDALCMAVSYEININSELVTDSNGG